MISQPFTDYLTEILSTSNRLHPDIVEFIATDETTLNTFVHILDNEWHGGYNSALTEARDRANRPKEELVHTDPEIRQTKITVTAYGTDLKRARNRAIEILNNDDTEYQLAS